MKNSIYLSIPLVCKTGKVILQIKKSMYLCIYLCHAMDPGNPEVTMLKEPISYLHFLAHCRCHRTARQNRYANDF